MRLCVVIPTKNESSTIGKVIQDIQIWAKAHSHVVEIIVSDDSKDDTAKIARSHGAVVLDGGGKGLGLAMLRGLKKSLSFDADVIISIDGDGQADVSELEQFVSHVVDGQADLVLGSRFKGGNQIHYSYPRINRLGVYILACILRRITGLKLTDSHGGIRAMRPGVVRSLHLTGQHTYVQESIIDASQKGYVIVEISSKWFPRRNGRSRVVSSITRYVYRTLPVIISRWVFPVRAFNN